MKNKNNVINIRATLKAISKKNHISFKDWAAKANIPIGTMNKISCGQSQNPTIGTLNALLNCMNLSLKDIDPMYHLEKTNLSEFITDDIPDNKKQLLQNVWSNSENTYELVRGYEMLSSQGKACVLKCVRELISYEKAMQKTNAKLEAAETASEAEMIDFPVYLLPTAAGYGSVLEDGAEYEEVQFPENVIPAKSQFALRVSGNSMLPEYQPDDYVFIKPTQNLEENDIGIFVLNNEGFIKQFKPEEHQLHSLNPEYAPIQISDYDDFRIIGKVVGKYSPTV